MVNLSLVESTDDRLVFKAGACAMLFQVASCTGITAVVAVSLTLFLRRYIGVFAFVFVAFPGFIVVLCGFLGCANARQFIFTFDKSLPGGPFTAQAGSVQLSRPMSDICLVHIERECGSGSFMGNEAPAFAVAVLFTDGSRCRLEGGVSSTGSGRGPEHLQKAAAHIRAFLLLPQQNTPVLNVSRASKDEVSPADMQQAEAGLSRWLACQGIAPRWEPALIHYDWIEPPVGRVRLPGVGPAFQSVAAGVSAYPGVVDPFSRGGGRWGTPTRIVDGGGLGGVVMGRPAQPQRQTAVQVTIPEGMPGQVMIVRAPDGSQITVTVPADMQAGEVMMVQY